MDRVGGRIDYYVRWKVGGSAFQRSARMLNAHITPTPRCLRTWVYTGMSYRAVERGVNEKRRQPQQQQEEMKWRRHKQTRHEKKRKVHIHARFRFRFRISGTVLAG